MADLFSEKAKDWDMNEMVLQLSKEVSAAILENIDLNDQMQVMDFGAGTGLITSHVLPHVKNIVAVDISKAMLDELISKTDFHGKVEIVCQDITEQPLDIKFDLIMSAMAMHHVKDTNLLIQRFAEHLNSGAQVALADLDAEDGTFHPQDIKGVFHDGFERDNLKSILEKNGFKDIQFITAHTVNKEVKSYPVFLVTALKT
jgi:cyclopropane fatty-acyl-phospholipid synthase-like methyltransferase